jgi:Uma2 family endonuclease
VDYASERYFTGSDLNLYYDVRHPLWYKRPDWFLAVGVPRRYGGYDFRLNYVTWQEGRPPYVIIELLSPGTESDDLGRFYGLPEPRQAVENPLSEPTLADADAAPLENSEVEPISPPSKVVVYEDYLRVPHYIVYNRRNQQWRYFQLQGGQYQEQAVNADTPNIWLADLSLGWGLWEGCFEGVTSWWLRGCDQHGNWHLTDTEQERLAKEQEQLAKEQAQTKLLEAARRLLASGQSLEEVATLLGLSAEQLEALDTP